ncbi:GerAB/ArcD/ProY family transporter [Alteribacter keqinensis]|uniref:Spore gernimation protein GerB n=1 Tax=Alteribacter keqinensis TaxID=2483800 RepID=A0A3M7TVS9_9BACI|nr:GerAB/ArcD/ProY family transporter [Alteribacter keqinensis]RNA69369.1 spore gernimation protein GerB [Alteribacter keqinensis]
MQTKIPERNLISPFLVMFLINAMQVGVGVLGFPRYIAKDMEYDGWIAVIISGLITSAMIWVIYDILKRGNGDVVSINKQVFGKWIGGLFTFLLLTYLLSVTLVVLRTFTEVIQVWIFPNLSTWSITAVYCILAYYCIVKGFRVVTGVCFFGVILSLITYFSLIGPLEFMEIRNLLPLFDASLKDYLPGIKTIVLSYLGIKMLFIYYPFIKKPETSLKWALAGNFLTIFMYLLVSFAAFIYFSPKQLSLTIWPLLTMWQIIELPFLERFEYLAIPIWGLVVLPNICLGLWATSRGYKLLFSINQHQTLILLLMILFCASIVFETRQGIDQLNTVVSEIGFYFTYVYIPFLWVAQKIRLKGAQHDVSKSG